MRQSVNPDFQQPAKLDAPESRAKRAHRRGRAIAQCDGTLPQTSGSQQIPSRKLEER